jgi:hypothetical protein
MAKGVTKRRARIATLAVFFSTSSATMLRLDPATNAAVGGIIASKISYMEAIVIRGGNSEITKLIRLIQNLETHPYQSEFVKSSEIVINNIFQEQAARRYIQSSATKFKIAGPTYLTSTKITISGSVSGTFLGISITCFLIFGFLYLFQYVERKRYENENNKILIDETRLRY